MDYAKFRYYVLCEDKAHYHFVRGWLQEKGVAVRKIVEPGYLPLGSCAKAYVREHFEAYRQKVNAKAQKENVALIVVMDADDLSMEEAIRNFSCTRSEPVFVIIPKWSIDTWARFLSLPDHAHALNEHTTCKPQYRHSHWGSLGKQLAGTSFEAIAALPSLKSTWECVASQKAFIVEK